MAADKNAPVLLIVVLAVFALAGAGVWWMDYQARRQVSQGPVLTSEAKAYLKNLQLSEVEMQAAESYLKQAVVEILGKITNNGDRELKLVEINCIFRDKYGQVVLRERVAIVRPKTGVLPPGEKTGFRLAFDNIPESWNHQMPDLVIAQIQFG